MRSGAERGSDFGSRSRLKDIVRDGKQASCTMFYALEFVSLRPVSVQCSMKTGRIIGLRIVHVALFRHRPFKEEHSSSER